MADAVKKKVIYKIEDKIEALKPLLEAVDYEKDEGMNKIIAASNEIIGDIIYSMRCDKNYNFFSLMLDRIDILIDSQLIAPMAVSFYRNHFRLSINPFLTFSTYDKYYIRAIIIHEAYHIIMNHIARTKVYLDSRKYHWGTINIGIDASINQYIPELRNSDDCITLETLAKMTNKQLHEIKTKMNCEYYIELLENSPINKPTPQELLDMLAKKLNEMKEKNSSGNGDEGNDNSSEESSNKEGNDDDQEEESSNKNRGRKVVKNHGGGNDLDKMLEGSNESADIADSVLRDLLKDTAAKCRGTIPEGVEEVLEALTKEPIIKWQDVLRNYIGRLPIPFKKTTSRLNRRMPKRLDIMGKLPDAYYRIVIAIDTSGSMSDDDIQLCMNEIWHIIKSQKKRFEITVIECDSTINATYEISKKRDFNKIRIKGRGGTAFSPVFEYLRENRRKYKDAVVIYFTDGYGENELTVKPLNYNNIWVLTDGHSELSLTKNYGRVLNMNIDEIRNKNRRNK